MLRSCYVYQIYGEHLNMFAHVLYIFYFDFVVVSWFSLHLHPTGNDGMVYVLAYFDYLPSTKITRMLIVKCSYVFLFLC